MNIKNLQPRAFWSSTTIAVSFSTILFALGAPSNAIEINVVKAETVGISSERLERIGVGMRRLIDADKIPGTVTLVARRGEVVHFETNGMRDVAKSLPMERDTIFRLYSQTKPVTGAAEMIALCSLSLG